MSLRLPLRRRTAQTSHRPRSTFISVLLLATLGLAALLARQAHTAASSHRAVAERTLRDYAAFAAWKSAGTVKNELGWVFGMALQPLIESYATADSSHLPSPSAFVVPPEKRKYIPPRLVLSYFRVGIRDSTCLAVRGLEPTRGVRAWMADTILAHAHTVYGADWKMAAITGVVDGRPHTLVYMLDKDQFGTARAAVGFELNPRALPPILARLYEEGHYLPPALMGDMANDDLLSVRVVDGSWRELFHSPKTYPDQFSASDSVGTALGGMQVHVALKPDVASRLVIGGLPHSRLPLLLGLLALTTGLVAAALLQHRREYELAALRSEFVSNVSHELRTPLAQIRMFAETLLLGRVRSPEERRRSLEIIDQEARRLTHLVENVLHFTRSERRAIRLAPEPTDLSGLVREVADGFLPLARARQVELELELDEGITASVDRSAVRQVLLNLMDNAVKYGPPGQTVTVATSAAAGRAWIRVDDEGPGIPPAERERVWERFSRLEREAESAVAGAGIGLAVVNDLVGRHGGRAWIDEAPGGGGRFVVELPLERLGEPDGAGDAAVPQAARGRTLEPAGIAAGAREEPAGGSNGRERGGPQAAPHESPPPASTVHPTGP